MSDRRHFVRAGAVLGGPAALGAPAVLRAQASNIKIGYSSSKTGPNAGGTATQNTPVYNMWVKEVNAAGGINVKGRKLPVEVVEYDDRSSSEEAVRAYERLATQDKVDFVFTPWGTALHLRCPLPGTRLRIGRTACVLVPSREIPVQRTYHVLNSASLVRWPDLTPLPCKDLTIETDFGSWCWALTATLTTPAAWPLVAPNPLACQVLATVNGLPWRFLLDVPNRTRSFNSDQVTIKGRSRSAWLHSPYLASADYSEANAREMQQLAEAALDNTGWSLDWQLANWVVPGGRYVGHNTPMGCLIRLANATDDGIYTAPDDQIITMYKRWPVASWLLDAAPVDLSVPMDAGYTLTESPVYTQPYNGVYVSGTSHGARALVKIAGTDGALQPTDPITHELLCDTAGVAATQRGLNALSDSGAGFEATLEMPLLDEIGLIRPGLVVSIAGIKGVSRSCRIHAAWDASKGLTVTQTVGLERREVEA